MYERKAYYHELASKRSGLYLSTRTEGAEERHQGQDVKRRTVRTIAATRMKGLDTVDQRKVRMIQGLVGY